MLFANVWMFFLMFVLLIVLFFAFDNIVLGGVIGRWFKRKAEAKFEPSACNQDCNQGR